MSEKIRPDHRRSRGLGAAWAEALGRVPSHRPHRPHHRALENWTTGSRPQADQSHAWPPWTITKPDAMAPALPLESHERWGQGGSVGCTQPSMPPASRPARLQSMRATGINRFASQRQTRHRPVDLPISPLCWARQAPPCSLTIPRAGHKFFGPMARPKAAQTAFAKLGAKRQAGRACMWLTPAPDGPATRARFFPRRATAA